MEPYKKDFIKQIIGLGFKLIAGTLNLVHEDGDEIHVLEVQMDMVKSNYDMELPLTVQFIRQISSITIMRKSYFEKVKQLFGIKII